MQTKEVFFSCLFLQTENKVPTLLMPNGHDRARNDHELPLPQQQEQLNRYSNVTEAAPDSGMGTRFTVQLK